MAWLRLPSLLVKFLLADRSSGTLLMLNRLNGTVRVVLTPINDRKEAKSDIDAVIVSDVPYSL